MKVYSSDRSACAVLMDTARQLLQLVSTEVEKHREELDQLEEDLAQALDADEGALHKPAWPGESLLKHSKLSSDGQSMV